MGQQIFEPQDATSTFSFSLPPGNEALRGTSKFMDQLGEYLGVFISEVPKENALSLPSPGASFRGPRIGGNTGLAALLSHADAHGVAGAGGIR